MAHDQEIKNQIQELLVSQKLAVLSTHHSGQPYASLVAFVAKKDLKKIFFLSPREPLENLQIYRRIPGSQY
jgi:hypothetical protein